MLHKSSHYYDMWVKNKSCYTDSYKQRYSLHIRLVLQLFSDWDVKPADVSKRSGVWVLSLDVNKSQRENKLIKSSSRNEEASWATVTHKLTNYKSSCHVGQFYNIINFISTAACLNVACFWVQKVLCLSFWLSSFFFRAKNIFVSVPKDHLEVSSQVFKNYNFGLWQHVADVKK